MTEKKPVKREPKAIRILDAVEAMQASDNLTDEDTINVLKGVLMMKVVQEARRQ